MCIARHSRTPTSRPAPTVFRLPLSVGRPIAVYHRPPVLKTDRRVAYDMHYALEIGVVLRGRMWRRVGKASAVFGPGDIWYHGPWEVHGYRDLRPPVELILCMIWPPMLAELRFAEAPLFHWMAPFEYPFHARPRVPAKRRPEAQRIARRLLEAAGEGPANRVRLRLALIDLLLLVVPDHLPQPSESAPRLAAPGSIEPAVALTLDAPGRVSVLDAANRCGMSRSQFMRVFTRLMRIPFGEFCMRQRLRRAAAQLSVGPCPVKAIAHEMGFTDVSHFDRTFVKYYGCTPSHYRQLSQAAPQR